MKPIDPEKAWLGRHWLYRVAEVDIRDEDYAWIVHGEIVERAVRSALPAIAPGDAACHLAWMPTNRRIVRAGVRRFALLEPQAFSVLYEIERLTVNLRRAVTALEDIPSLDDPPRPPRLNDPERRRSFSDGPIVFRLVDRAVENMNDRRFDDVVEAPLSDAQVESLERAEDYLRLADPDRVRDPSAFGPALAIVRALLERDA